MNMKIISRIGAIRIERCVLIVMVNLIADRLSDNVMYAQDMLLCVQSEMKHEFIKITSQFCISNFDIRCKCKKLYSQPELSVRLLVNAAASIVGGFKTSSVAL